MATYWQYLKGWKPLLVVILTPLLLLTLPLIVRTQESKAAYVLFLMAVYWLTEVIPMGVTALIPSFLFPMMGLISAKDVAKSYMSDLILLFLGSMFIAVTIERWNLHRRIALRILLHVGSEPRWLMLGMMLSTWFLSMWISNSAAAAMMSPIIAAILQQLKDTLTVDKEQGELSHKDKSEVIMMTRTEGSRDEKDTETVPTQDSGSSEDARTKARHFRQMSKGMSLSICYAASTGGIATLTGTGSNLVLKENIDKLYSDHGLSSPVNFASWMGFALPFSLLLLLACWIWLQIAFLRCRDLSLCCSRDGAKLGAIIREQYDKLGPISFAEGSVLFWLVLLVVLWISRDLGGIGGWSDIFPERSISDATPAIFIGVCLFVFPSQLPFSQKRDGKSSAVSNTESDTGNTQLQPLLLWSEANRKVPWSLVLLLGGGFALSKGCQVSGLSAWLGKRLEVFTDVDRSGVLFIVCCLCAAMTEFTSNVAIAILLLPILSTLALRTGVHPLYYLISGALSCSFGYMFPVATPPNAIAFAYGHIRIIDMALAGFVLKLISVPLLVLAIGTWGTAMFDLNNIPSAFVNSTSVLGTD